MPFFRVRSDHAAPPSIDATTADGRPTAGHGRGRRRPVGLRGAAAPVAGRRPRGRRRRRDRRTNSRRAARRRGGVVREEGVRVLDRVDADRRQRTAAAGLGQVYVLRR